MFVALLAVAALLAAINWWSRFADNGRVETWSKPLTTIAVLGVALASGAPRDQLVVAAVALVLCLLGDILLMPVVDQFVGGLAAFLLGHVAFIVLFVKYGLENVSLAGLAIVLVALLGAGDLTGK